MSIPNEKLFGKDWWREPYTVERRVTVLWIIALTRYEIMFEGTCVGTANTLKAAEDLAGVLNGAYNLGRSNMRLEIESL